MQPTPVVQELNSCRQTGLPGVSLLAEMVIGLTRVLYSMSGERP